MNKVLEYMIKEGTVPSDGTFTVTKSMINRYFDVYRKVHPSKNCKLKNSNIKYAKRLAGLTLMKLNISRSENIEYAKTRMLTNKPSCGLIYLISNIAFEGYYKVGITQNLEKRLAVYQTGDPLKRYKVEHYRFVENIREEEKRILDDFSLDVIKGEWINSEKVKELFLELE